MSIIVIEEYNEVVLDGAGRLTNIPGALRFDQKITLSGASQQSAALSGKIVTLLADAACWYLEAADPTVTNAGGLGNRYLPANTFKTISVTVGNKIAVIAA